MMQYFSSYTREDMIRTKHISKGDIFSYLCIVYGTLVSYDDTLNRLALYVMLPSAFLWCFSHYDLVKNNQSFKILVFLYIWLCFCYPFSGNFGLANEEMRKVIGAFILCFTTGALALKKRFIPYLYLIPILTLIAAWIYAQNNILTVIDIGQERLDDLKLNANTLAYYTFYVTIALFILGDILRNNLRKYVRLLFFAMIILSFYTAIYTASRQILIIQLPLIALLLWDRYLRKSAKGIMVLLFIIVLSIVFFKTCGESIYENSLLKQRNELSVENDARVRISRECIELGIKSPIIGYGPGNSVANISTHNFAHNTFLELLVNTGIPGMLIFLYMIFIFVRSQYKRWKHTKDRLFLTFLIFGLIWLFDQMFYVFYDELWLMSFFILVSVHSDQYYKEICLMRCNTLKA